ncbi:MAG TPA: MgtC/SapB family protein [Nevskiaceae bacterium]|nr:MgtC/SapB family protein [Nevskiaceae bacterium]
MLSTPEIAIRLLLAAALGGIIGFDRERHTWVAGLRTHMLVCVGSALVMIVSAFGFADVLGKQADTVLDPSRIAAQVVSGIGFLGAGTIMFMHRDNTIRGLTTAAGLWTVAAIGLAVGGGMYQAAGIATAVTWIVLAVLKPVERRFALSRRLPLIRIGFVDHASLGVVEQLLEGRDLPMHTILSRHIPDDGDEVTVEFERGLPRADLLAFADALRGLPGVATVSLESGAPQ